ncbi:membrane protein insertase YidC [Fundicoccus culcitae]|uniref:Membrane protein insertase YidC n=1 Tax=Fundicoccus culcitae TaxID=2969821 RepID=A0ABY5P3T6_9LACT|nr:membrane protein insertase YidC [Fundicoccus culcitae]UUX33075.1 membrane protein insertase YidC [Fundicoccus culcitae]
MKKYRKWIQIGLLLGIVLFLTACGNTNEAVSAESTGFWDRYVIYNLSQFIVWLSNLMGGSYALGIIVFTIIVRLLLLPLNNMQTKSQRKMMEIQPELDAIKEKYPNQDKASMEAMQQEQQALLDERGVNQFAGCLPLAIQLPVMMALYQSILRTDVLREGTFLWTNLGEMDPYFILPILAALLTFANSYLTMKSNPTQNTTSKMMIYVMPIMILIISLGLPSAITLYWVVSNAFTVVQTLIFNNPYKIIAEREAKAQAEKDRQRELKKALKRAKRR